MYMNPTLLHNYCSEFIRVDKNNWLFKIEPIRLTKQVINQHVFNRSSPRLYEGNAE